MAAIERPYSILRAAVNMNSKPLETAAFAGKEPHILTHTLYRYEMKDFVDGNSR